MTDVVPRISVVIRCFNEERHIGRLLAGIFKQILVPQQVIVVDSGSTDATLEIARRFPVQVVNVDRQTFSFGRSLNEGVGVATGEFVLLASAHVYPVYDSWVRRLHEPFIDDPRLAISYGGQQGNEDTRFSEHRVFATWFPAHPVQKQDHPFCNNANALIRRSVWEEIPYDESLTGLEDLDWAKRAMHAGYTVSYVPEARVVHVHEEGWSDIVQRYRREAIAHKRIFEDQRMSLGHAFMLLCASIGADWWEALKTRRLLGHLSDVLAFRTAQFWGTYRGFAHQGPVSAALKRRFYYPVKEKSTTLSEKPPLGADQPITYSEEAIDK